MQVQAEQNASALERAQARRSDEALTWRRSFLIALLLTLPVVLLMWVIAPMKSLEPLLMVQGIDVAGELPFHPVSSHFLKQNRFEII